MLDQKHSKKIWWMRKRKLLTIYKMKKRYVVKAFTKSNYNFESNEIGCYWYSVNEYIQGRNEVRWRLGQEASLAPPCSNLRSFGSKFSVLKKVPVTLLGLFGALRSGSASPYWLRRGILPPCHPSLRPRVYWFLKLYTKYECG